MGEREKCWFMNTPGVAGSYEVPNQFIAAGGGCLASSDNAFSCCAHAAERAMQSKKPELVQAVQDAHDKLAFSTDPIGMLQAAALERELKNHH